MSKGQIKNLKKRVTALEAKLDPPPLVATTIWDRGVDERITALEAALAKPGKPTVS
jgi:hypothetical protein